MENSKGTDTKKTQVFNVIILDRSGSMGCIRRAAVDGFNETLSGIKKAQENFADTQDHYVTLVTFCSCEMRQVFDKVPAAEATGGTPARQRMDLHVHGGEPGRCQRSRRDVYPQLAQFRT